MALSSQRKSRTDDDKFITDGLEQVGKEDFQNAWLLYTES